VFSGILLFSTVLLVKRGYEGLGRVRISLICSGCALAIFLGIVTETRLAIGYWCWVGAFILSLAAHLFAYRRGGTLDATYLFHDDEH
jgi:Flp pilus assembly protein protease CpaA